MDGCGWRSISLFHQLRPTERQHSGDVSQTIELSLLASLYWLLLLDLRTKFSFSSLGILPDRPDSRHPSTAGRDHTACVCSEEGERQRTYRSQRLFAFFSGKKIYVSSVSCTYLPVCYSLALLHSCSEQVNVLCPRLPPAQTVVPRRTSFSFVTPSFNPPQPHDNFAFSSRLLAALDMRMNGNGVCYASSCIRYATSCVFLRVCGDAHTNLGLCFRF